MKKAIGITLYLLLFLFSGYWVGKNPDFYKDTITLGNSLPKVYFDNENSFSPALIQKMKSISHLDFDIISEKPETADLWITHEPFLKTAKSFNLKFHLLQNKTISPDFRLQEQQEFHSLPLAWKTLDQKIHIVTLTAPIQNKSKQSRAVQMLIQSLFSKEFQLEMIQGSDWNTVVLTLDEMNIPKERKASAIRAQSLLNTNVE